MWRAREPASPDRPSWLAPELGQAVLANATDEPDQGDRNARSAMSTLLVGLFGGIGILAIAWGFSLARGNDDLTMARVLLWVGLAALTIPPFVTLYNQGTTRGQRMVVLAITGGLLYVVKVLYAADHLLLPDEVLHLANAQHIVEDGRLYSHNPILPVSPSYPGMAAIAAAFAQVTGLSVTASALVTVGIARVILMLGLFLLFERLTDEPRAAGVGALLFAASPNFLYWGAQFAYESLAFPLFVVCLLCVVQGSAGNGRSRAWWVVAAIVAAGVIVTHHVTAFALAAVLAAMAAAAAWQSRPWRLLLAVSLLVALVAVVWADLVAKGTGSYLGDIFGRAYDSIAAGVTESQGTRAPFAATGFKTPLDDKLLAAASALLAVGASAWGAFVLRHRRRADPLVTLLLLGAVAAPAAYALRVFPGAWEPANRASSYVFLGVGFVVGTVLTAKTPRRRSAFVGATAVAVFVGIAGASVLGWPAAGQLPRPETVRLQGGEEISSQTLTTVRWFEEHVPRSRRIVADENVGRGLLVAGYDHLVVGRNAPGPELLHSEGFSAENRDYLARHVDYVVLDRRKASADNIVGRFFARPGNDAAPGTYPRSATDKYGFLPGAQRLFDSGDVVVFSVRRLAEVGPNA